MTEETIQRIEALLAGDVDRVSREELEVRYPARALPDGAIVTRSAPSPTGFLHIGTVYMCLLNQYFARQTGGVYMLRMEDTDKKREVAGGVERIITPLEQFGLLPQEGVRADSSSYGAYGPYLQSQRKELYLTFAIELLRKGRAYPCFATREELEQNTASQQAAKVRPGYYGQWALWRDKTDADVRAALDAGLPFVLRFRSQGSHENRVTVHDVLKGSIELPENDLDVPLIKADGTQLPTYHLAHVVDDYLMRSTIILRGDEWLPSTPLHIELAQALDIQPFTYAHFAPISIIDKNGGGKRKLSKRKDPEADVQFWLGAGYPIDGIKAYLLGLANSSFEEWYVANPKKALEDYTLSIEKLAASRAPLLDHAKLENYCKDYFARLPQEAFNTEIIDWAKNADTALYEAMQSDKEYTKAVLAIERSGDKPRKDLAKREDVRDQYGYFFEAPKPGDIAELLSSFSAGTLHAVRAGFLATYDINDDQPTWFLKLKQAAETCGFATDNKAFKEDAKLPEAERKFVGNTADFAKILRVSLTGKDRTPDLYTIMQVMGEERVQARLTTS